MEKNGRTARELGKHCRRTRGALSENNVNSRGTGERSRRTRKHSRGTMVELQGNQRSALGEPVECSRKTREHSRGTRGAL